MIIFIVSIIHRVFQILSLIVIIDVILSYFMSPYHPIKQTLDRFVEPMLAPIRRILPSTGMLDFSPFVLLIVLQVLDMILTRILLSL